MLWDISIVMATVWMCMFLVFYLYAINNAPEVNIDNMHSSDGIRNRRSYLRCEKMKIYCTVVYYCQKVFFVRTFKQN